MFAAAAPLPYYSSYGFGSVGRPASSKKAPKKGHKDDASSSASRPVTQAGPAEGRGSLEPAMEGPPSPEKIRALNKQMQRASAAHSSSQSSSLRSFNTDTPSWEQTLENVALSRRSSARSTSSSMPSRERPESVQLFGKTIFTRRGKSKRESSANSSSGSSLYSTDMPAEVVPPPLKDQQHLPAIFGRKKNPKLDLNIAARARSNSASSKKFQISGPYDFKHVTHTRREHFPPAPATSHGEAASNSSTLPDAEYSDARGLEGAAQIEMDIPSPISPHRLQQRSQMYDSSPRRLVKRTRSSEQLNGHATRSSVAPPRPPRSPTEYFTTSTSPTVPPRLSSRTSMRPDGLNSAGSMGFDPLSTGAGFRQPRPFAITREEQAGTTGDQDDQVPELAPSALFSHALTTPGDAAWPLPSTNTTFTYEGALPDVPEEDEQAAAARRSRLSITSNSSSLRGSQSVPLLRLSAQLQSAARQRPPSGASDTLGRFDLSAAQRALKAGADDQGGASMGRESWEDDIDYCYEHEAEADCNFAWDRLSQISTEDDGPKSAPLPRDISGAEDFATEAQVTPLMPVPARHYELPIMGSVSPGASSTPAGPIIPVTSNFSHPRNYTSRRQTGGLHVRTNSQASSFKESHGFTLSPSLLIPGDFQQQMIMANSQGVGTYVDDAASPSQAEALFAGASPIGIDMPGVFNSERASTSTVDTASSVQTGSSGERHISTNSNFTAPTRYTGSTTFEGWDPKVLEASEPVPSVHLDDTVDVFPLKTANIPQSPLSDDGDMMSRSTGDIRDHPSKVDEASPQSHNMKETVMRHRRQRAHTTSSSMSAGGYALFPPAYSGNRV